MVQLRGVRPCNLAFLSLFRLISNPCTANINEESGVPFVFGSPYSYFCYQSNTQDSRECSGSKQLDSHSPNLNDSIAARAAAIIACFSNTLKAMIILCL